MNMHTSRPMIKIPVGARTPFAIGLTRDVRRDRAEGRSRGTTDAYGANTKGRAWVTRRQGGVYTCRSARARTPRFVRPYCIYIYYIQLPCLHRRHRQRPWRDRDRAGMAV